MDCIAPPHNTHTRHSPSPPTPLPRKAEGEGGRRTRSPIGSRRNESKSPDSMRSRPKLDAETANGYTPPEFPLSRTLATTSMSEVTRILSAIEQGDPHAAEQLLPLVYNEL